MSDIKFPEGIMAKKPNENAPDFVKAKVSIKRAELITWLQSQSDEWINLDLKESKKGGLYFSVDDWKPTRQNNIPEPTESEPDDLPW